MTTPADLNPSTDLPRPADARAEWTSTGVLVRRSKDGQREALERLFDRYYDRVVRIVRIRTGAKLRRRVGIEDIVQNTLLVAFQNFDRFEWQGSASLIKWLTRFAGRQVLRADEHHRAAKRSESREEGAADGRASESARPLSADSRFRVSQSIIRREAVEILDRIVADTDGAAPGDWREVILLRDYHGGSWKWVAEEMGRSVEAVQELHRRARLDWLGPALKRAGF